MFSLADPIAFGDGFNTEFKECYKYDDSEVYFLLSKRGEALEIHIAAVGRKGKRRLREALRAMVKEVPKMFPWCRMLIGPVKSASVYNLAMKCGFVDSGSALFEKGEANIMVINYGYVG
jgi:hypothetical protein